MKFFKNKEGYIGNGMAIIPAIPSTTGAFCSDLLRLFLILATVAVLAGGDGNKCWYHPPSFSWELQLIPNRD